MRRAFTLVELLVCIAIIGVLLALIIPAVQWMREAARRTQCQNNCRQLGLATHTYHDIYQVLPVSVGPWQEGPRPTALPNGKGWIVSILPHLEQAGLYDLFAQCFDGDFNAGDGIMSLSCREAMRTKVIVLHCPSDSSSSEASDTQFEWEGIEVAVTNYKGVLGDHQIGGPLSSHVGTLPDCHVGGGCNGLFFRVSYQEPQTLAHVLDGSSNTLFIGEDLPSENHHSAAFYANGDYCSCHGAVNFKPRPSRPRDWWDVMTFRSRHSGGVMFCLVDGSVRFVNQTIDHGTYRGLCTKANGEIALLP